MKSESIALTIMTTTKCSAECIHCPFSHPKMTQRELKVEKIKSLINNSNEELVVLSGGEFFEHSKIDELLENLSEVKDKKFRIATGNHIDLSPYIEKLKTIKNLEGISVGTDTLLKYSNRWKENLLILEKNQIPYSLTFSLFPQSDLKIVQSLIFVNQIKVKPNFVYVRVYHEESYFPFRQIETLEKNFKKIPMLIDHLN